MISFQIELDTSDYDFRIAKFQRRIPNLPERFVDEGSKIMFDKWKSIINVKTGRMRDTSTREVHGRVAIIGTHTGYGAFVNSGFGPHEIVARIARVLAFPVGDKTIFSRRVMHPGYPGSQFAERTVTETEQEVKDALLRIYNEEVS